MEDNLKKIKMEDDPQKIMENNLKKMKTMEDDIKKEIKDDLKKLKNFLIPLKFRGKPFLGLAQLSKIFLNIVLSNN